MPILKPTDLQLGPPDPKWLVYQKAVAELKESSGDYEAIHDLKIIGRHSGVERQVDIWLAGSDGVTVAVECKCFTKPVGIKHVDAFHGFLDDVGATKGVLISNTGFTGGAKKRAVGSTVELETLTLEEAESFNWTEYVQANMCKTSGYWCTGSVRWEFDDDEGSKAGYCGGCGSLHVECGECGTVGTYDRSRFKCDGCDTEWRLIEHKGEVIGFYRVEPDDE